MGGGWRQVTKEPPLSSPPKQSDDAPHATSKHLDGRREVSSRAVTINRPVQEVYDFYRDLTNAPLYMENVDRVEVVGNDTHWMGNGEEWNSTIINDVPGKEITWQGNDNSGRATFTEIDGRGTVLTLTLAYEQGLLSKVVGKLTQDDPAIQARRSLRRLKQLLETGEIATNARNQKMLADEKQ